MPDALPMGWRALRLDQLGAVERGRSRHRPRNAPFLYNGQHPFIQTGDVKAAGLRVYQYSQTYSDAGLAQSRLWPVGTLCITIAANICDTALLGIPACFPDSIVGFTADRDTADAVFVKYALDFAKQRFTGISKGTTQDNLSVEKMLSQHLAVPSLSEQRRIASILSAYDDLIEVNRRRVTILEEMARRLFEEWFVHLRFPGHATTPLHDTPDGPVPGGWHHLPLAAVARVNQAALRPGSAPNTIQYVDIASVSPGRVEHVLTCKFADAPGRARRLVRDGSIIWSTVRPNRRGFALMLDPEPDLVVSTGFAVLDAYSVPDSYLYAWTTTDAFVSHLVNHATGSAYPAVTGATFERAKVLVPSVNVARAYDSQVAPMLRLADKLNRVNARLAAARDLLLPRLLSGQLSVTRDQGPTLLAAE